MITENDSLRRTASYTVEVVNIVLISTYELGRQPFGLASPAAWLRKRGHQVVCLDLSRQSLDESAVRAAGLIAIYLPMHTATRLAAKLIPTLRELNPLAASMLLWPVCADERGLSANAWCRDHPRRRIRARTHATR